MQFWFDISEVFLKELDLEYTYIPYKANPMGVFLLLKLIIK
jgi:hypothetical protein